MFLNKVYYFLKPVLPYRLRLALRRLRAKSKRNSCADVWPIDQKAGLIPPNWPGWPNDKQFAFVLTHDVEGSKGLARVEKLMELEMKYGFRSSFNFVPEGEYRVPEALRQKLEQSGFEVGVHGLEHDGKLYNSKSRFTSKAAEIRKYLKAWNVVGFRSPVTQHRLGWLHELGAEYDASTFDTDPFEPEPYGVKTIFPFWVPGPQSTGYVELPYSLVQDFTLFKVLRENNIEIWKRKLDWVASRGGMALVNVHPDYLCFEGNDQQRDEFQVSFYEDLLRYIRDHYQGAYWPAVPRDVVRYYRDAIPFSSRNTRKKICMLAYTVYESDNRVRRYAETLIKRGDHVEVIALSGPNEPLGTTEVGGVTLHRIQRRDTSERTKWTYVWRLLSFFLRSSVFLTRRHRRVQFDLIHVHNMPDFLVFAAWYPKWTGVKLILDIHDIMPELFSSKFGAKAGDSNVTLLKQIEKASVAFADHVIVSNDLWSEKLMSRSLPKEKCSVFVNYVDPSVFYRRPRTRHDGKFVILFPGSFQWHQGLDIAIEAFSRLLKKLPNAELHLYGGGTKKADLMELAARLGLQEKVKFSGSLPLERIVEVIANADLGVVPKRADSFGNEAYSTKIMEFMSQGVPVVVSRTKIDTFYFDDKVVRFFESGNVSAMAAAMLEVFQNKALHESLILRGYNYVDRHNWDRMKGSYIDLVDALSTEIFDGVSGEAKNPLMVAVKEMPSQSEGFLNDHGEENASVPVNGDEIGHCESAVDTNDQSDDRAGRAISQTDLYDVLVTVWSDVLGLKHVAIHDNFFDLGGDSVLATQMLSRLRELFRMELPPTAIFEAATIADLAAFMKAREPRPGLVERVATILKTIEGMTEEEVSQVIQAKVPRVVNSGE